MKEILERQSRKREEDSYILQQIIDDENNKKMTFNSKFENREKLLLTRKPSQKFG